ncbi:tyramine receptor 1-like [Stylophora pistillata]|uniref:D(1)-like dopamine receptor n=1 Tax=Stylophora pistillata TaxID=50429 RepID=A0A2B4SUH3_STYPI|nr:tyramine receptor 1-like [Stylophora pistillata]XP_022779626.1 tyramine receptor 1-like [Stylophora pistillata]XP_022779627.1 tyramine receptor 1-like [Stylophora pistillata]XP_022779628.1 tyramine receptor 1-like [Stylophora pistillata]XP_022779629.1 tyramine receptor 1-like [Stylophora pistillata]XP_022779631.1 tyramine receptor 1-like [Stylophora pistillata]PFX32228.1 D(1)-like dopamine receptor [Stylophora pistillata]
MSSGNQTNPTPNMDLPCQEKTKEEYIYQTAFLILIMLVTFLGNFMVCLTVYLHQRLRTVTNYFIVSLAVSDLLLSLLYVPFRIEQTIDNGYWCLRKELCATWIVIDLVCTGASIYNLAAISVDRYIAIVHPFRYHSVMTTKVARIIIAIIWAYSITWAGFSGINWTDSEQPPYNWDSKCFKKDKIFYTITTVTDFFFPLMVILIMYGLVFRVAMTQARAVASLQPQLSKRDGRGRRFSINIVKEVKAAKTLAIVIGAFVVCWLPFFVFLLVSLWDLSLLTPPKVSEDVLTGLRATFLYVLPAINSTLNPIIYALFNKEFRTAFVRLLRRTCGRPLTNSDDAHYSMNSSVLNDGHKTTRTNGKSRKTRFHEVQGDDDPSSDEPKHV